MGIESGGYNEGHDEARPFGGSFSEDTGNNGINAFNSGNEMAEKIHVPLERGGDVFVPKEPSMRISPFPVVIEAAEQAVEREITLIQSEGSDDYIATTTREVRRENATLVSSAIAEGARLGTEVSSEAGTNYVLGTLVGYKALDAQTDGTLPTVTSHTIAMDARDREEDALLSEISWGQFNPKPGPDADYYVAMAKVAPPSETNPHASAAFMKGASDAYRLVKDADEVRKLNAQYRLQHRRFC